MVGSSPRVRGKRASLARIPAPIRLIPACTGKTNPTDNRNRASRAHPRVCGENGKAQKQTDASDGSSPRMRGKLKLCAKRCCQFGLIPAHAGKTVVALSSRLQRWAHPRACGEDVDYRPRPRPELGSSPRMRGKLSSTDAFFRFSRLIPAHAGKTHGNARASAGSAAHPRACGENAAALPAAEPRLGSSPRMRGKPMFLATWLMLIGLIPAHAGKTIRASDGRGILRAHPRACGENNSGI